MNTKSSLSILIFCAGAAISVSAQDIFLSAYKKMPTGFSKDVDKISFSEDSKLLAVTDAKGNLAIIETESSKILKEESASGKIIFHEFVDKDHMFLTVKSNGEFYTYPFSSYTKTKGSQTFSSPTYVTLDPNQGYLTVLQKSDQIEIFDLKANMTQSRIQPKGDMKNTLFLGFDRFGQQLASINNIGETFSWEFINQKFLRELKLQSGEYEGSRSVIQTASTSKGADNFVIGLQELFSPKAVSTGNQQVTPPPQKQEPGSRPNQNLGMLNTGPQISARQLERRNMIIAYDWATGQEKKRVQVHYRPDGLALGPTPSTVLYFSSDIRTIFIVNLDKGEVHESVAVDDRPTSISLSDDGSLLAVGTASGEVSLFEVIRNNPAEIRIIHPSINRNIGEQTIKGTSVTIEGKVESQDRISGVMINDQKADFNFDGTFRSTVNLVPGKNRIRIAAQNTQSQFISKDVYLTAEPDQQKTSTADHSTYSKRMALVIGNADYTAAGKLRNTLNDAKAMTQVLKNLGFDVMVVENGSYESMKNAIYAFGDRIQDVDVSLFFYAGHGMEVDGTNYLVPVDADIQSHLDIKQKCVPLTGVSNTMEFANDEGLNMIILDACRNNPFPAGKRGGAGLARVNAPSGTLIAYATDPGSVASDGDGTNGLYTGELIKQLSISQRIEDIFMNTRNNVERISGGKQRPWEEQRLKGVFYLK